MATTCKTYAVPGGKGDPGPPGANGTSGQNAYTSVTTSFVMPAEGGTVAAAVGNSDWMTIGQLVYVSGGGTMQVSGKPSSTSATLLNVENTASGLYTGNVAPGTTIASGNTVSPSGLQGPSGAAAGGALLIVNNLSDVADVVVSRNNLGLDTAAQRPVGDFLQVVNNLSDVADAATSRTNLGLDDMALQNSGNILVTGGTALLTLVATQSMTSGDFELTVPKPFALLFASQTMGAGTAIDSEAASSIYVAGSGTPITITATPSVTAGLSDGQLLYLRGNHATNTITLQDEGTLASSGLKLGAATRLINRSNTLLLQWDANQSRWVEVGYFEATATTAKVVTFTGSGADFTPAASATYEKLTFGGGDAEVTLTPGTWLVTATVTVDAPNSWNQFIKLRNVTAAADIATSERAVFTGGTGFYQVISQRVITLTSTSTIEVWFQTADPLNWALITVTANMSDIVATRLSL